MKIENTQELIISKKFLNILLLVCLLMQGCQHTTSIPTTGEYQISMGSFDSAMLRLMEKWEIPGASMAVLQDGEMVLERGYGYADVDIDILVQPDSLFRIASVSKPITAAAVLTLVEDGLLDLNTPAFQVLDFLQPLDDSQVDSQIYSITIRNLLEHTGGWDWNISFDPMFKSMEIAREMGMSSPADCTTIIRYMLGQPLDFEPGSQYVYSNFGYCVLGRVIEKISGQPYESYVIEHVLKPSGINNMRLGKTLIKDRAAGEVLYYSSETDQAQSVFQEVEGAVPWPYGGFNLEAMDSHGGWIASAGDLVRFAYAIDPGNPQPVLKMDTLELGISRPDTPTWEGKSSYYAMGWNVRPEGNGKTVWHTGSIPGTMAIVYRKSNGLIWAALFNTRLQEDNDFMVDLITEIGKAAFMNDLIIYAVIFLVLVAGMIIIFVQWKRRKQRRTSIDNN